MNPRLDLIIAYQNALFSDEEKRQEQKYWRMAGWSSQASQRIRFQRLLQTSAYQGGDVLDWGSGPGDLYAYLKTTPYPFRYHGIDVNPTMVRLSSERFGPFFRQVDLSYSPTTSYDFVFASGIFQFKDPKDPEYYIRSLEQMYSCARRGVAANFLSSGRESAEMAESELYVDAAALCGKIQSIAPHWVVDHSYHPGFGDFTVALLRPDPELRWRRPARTRPRREQVIYPRRGSR